MRALLLIPSLLLLSAVVWLGSGRVVADDSAEDPGESRLPEPLVLYDFSETNGDIVRDHAPGGQPIDLKIDRPQAVHRDRGSLEIKGKAVIASAGPARKLIDAVRASGAITIEAWAQPADTKQEGPARIVSLSRDTSNRNFTLGQEANHYDVRLRSGKASNNGLPSIASPKQSLTTEPTHIVYTREPGGRARVYLNGERVAEKRIDGALNNWDRSYRLAIGNELTGDRPWRGTLFRIALYDSALTGKQVAASYAGGYGEVFNRPVRATAAQARFFHSEVAPLLSAHCLSCHGWDKTKGRLDLTNAESVLAGGVSGSAITPGDPASSLVWETVESDEMPKDNPALSAAEKATLKRWIEQGAPWPGKLERIDPPSPAHATAGDSHWVQRLTVYEYITTVRAAVGVDIAEEAERLLPRDRRADGFTNTAYNLTVDLGHVQAYAGLSSTIVSRMDVSAFAQRHGGKGTLAKQPMRELIGKMGMTLLRGPLTSDEVDAYLPIIAAVQGEGGGYEEAVGFILEAMLQSPRFLYRIEQQRRPGERVGSYEMANRLSYMLWGAPPDEVLMREAASGALSEAKGINRAAQRMLKDPRAVTRSKRFVTEWLGLDRLAYMRPSPKHFPDWDPALAADMRDETLKFFEYIVWEKRRPLTDLLNAQVTFATGRLAKHYGLKPKSKTQALYDLTKTPERGGLLTQGSLLTIGGDEASMVTRGLFVYHELLRGKIEDPPPCVDTTPVASEPGMSRRAVAMTRITNQACAACHSKFEPLAFAFERYDGLGRYSLTDEHDNPLREDGEITIPEEPPTMQFKHTREMLDAIAKSDRVGRTLTRKAMQFALGRPLRPEDDDEVERIHSRAIAEGGTWAAVMNAIVTATSPAERRIHLQSKRRRRPAHDRPPHLPPTAAQGRRLGRDRPAAARRDDVVQRARRAGRGTARSRVQRVLRPGHPGAAADRRV